MLQPPKRSLLLASLIGIPLILIALWQLPKLQVAPLQERMKSITNPEKLADLEKERIVAENNIRTSMIQGIAGLFVAITAYVAWRNLKETQRNIALTQRNVEATEAKQVAERFSKAVELLANESIYAQLGGIYALEKIAQSEDDYYWQVMETLTAYVREKSPASTDMTNTEESLSLKTDIQAVMTVIARRKYSYIDSSEPYPLNLTKVDLRSVQLPQYARLSGVDFSDSNLQGAMLTKTDLEGASFLRANLHEAEFVGANLKEVCFFAANLQNACLELADLQDADLTRAKLQKAQLGGAKFHGAGFLETDLQESKFQQKQLSLIAEGLIWDSVIHAKNWQEAELPDYLLQNRPVEGVEGTGK